MSQYQSEFALRKQKAQQLRENGVQPYPARANRSMMIQDFLDRFDEQEKSGQQETICGRIMLTREHGKLLFFDILDDSGHMQLVVNKNDIGDQQFAFIQEYIDTGDIVEATGTAFRTKRGERSLLASDVRILAKALSPLPDKWHGIQDDEMRHRKRYLDILMNPELKALFIRKSRFWQATREFLMREEFLEVETPVLENTTGGADATPFMTHHNALDIDVFLRISMGELWQKRLMVAGFEKTFEIGRQFRNEGISPEHLQDYTQMEMYWAFADYQKGMELTERMYKYIIQEAFGTLQFNIRGFDVDLSSEWKVIDYTQTIEEMIGINVLHATDEELATKYVEVTGSTPEVGAGRGRLIDILWKQCRKQIGGPVFLVHHPVEVSPLAKRREEDPCTVERFQIIIAGSELGNGYSELNDPIDQRERFEEQARLRAAGDTEAQMNDEEFVEALEHGMPPTCGFGFSERLFAFFADKPIRETVLFPLMRPKIEPSEENIQRAQTLPSTESEQATISSESSESEPVYSHEIPTVEIGITREEATAYLKKHLTEPQLLKHSFATGYQMEALAGRFGVENTNAWFIAGLLHDVDYEAHPSMEAHGQIGAQMLQERGIHPAIVSAVQKHNRANGSSQPSSLLEKSLCSLEQLTGLVMACVAVRPDKDINSLEVKSVKKKLKDKSFARGVNREYISRCEEWTGLSVDEAIEITINAMKKHAESIGI